MKEDKITRQRHGIVTSIVITLIIRDTHYRKVHPCFIKKVRPCHRKPFLPCQPSDEAAGISANDKFPHLVQNNQCQGECHGYKEVFCGDITRLEDVMEDGYVTEENAYEQRADRGGYDGAVHAPRRWLLEDTRSSRARREQVTPLHHY